jgi:hypothetical protein
MEPTAAPLATTSTHDLPNGEPTRDEDDGEELGRGSGGRSGGVDGDEAVTA